MSTEASRVDEPEQFQRSPELMEREDTAILVVDVQEKLVNLIADRGALLWNIGRLLRAGETMGLAHFITEQNPAKLGSTAASLQAFVREPHSKISFSCFSCRPMIDAWVRNGITRVLVCGIETHVCIQQTALDLSASGYQVYVPVDAVGARHSIDHHTALRRMENAGIILTTTEAAIFEWCRSAGTPEFRQIMALAKESPPEA